MTTDAVDSRDAGTRPTGPAAERPRNVVFILTDDQRADTLGVTGNPVIQTPNLDALARRGVLFENNFVTTSICPVSRASILTGQYASHHGLWGFSDSMSYASAQRMYPSVLRNAGYNVGFVGKWGIGGVPAGDRFDHFSGFASGPYYEDYEMPRGEHLTVRIAAEAMDFLATQNRDTPFCLSVSFKAPHVPFVPIPELRTLYEGTYFEPPASVSWEAYQRLPPVLRGDVMTARCFRRSWDDPEITYSGLTYQQWMANYYRMVSGIDQQVGKLVDALQQLGLADDTAIVFTSDNGLFLADRLLCGKWFMYEESIRTPMIVFDPRAPQTAGTVRSEMSLNIDVHPTICALADVTVPDGTDGRSLLPLIRDEATQWRDEWFYEHLFEHERVPKSEGVRTERWKYVTYVETDPLQEELYDLQTDPGETSNLAAVPEHQATLDQMRARHHRLRAAI